MEPSLLSSILDGIERGGPAMSRAAVHAAVALKHSAVGRVGESHPGALDPANAWSWRTESLREQAEHGTGVFARGTHDRKGRPISARTEPEHPPLSEAGKALLLASLNK